MVNWARYGRRRWRYRKYRRFYRRFRRSYARRYVNASSRSSIRAKCVVTGDASRSSGYATTLGNVFSIKPLASYSSGSNPCPLTQSPLHNAYIGLYEEMKIIGMKVQICVTDQIGNTTLPSLQIYTAWDRHYGSGEATYTAAEIKNSASNNVATALNNNIAKISRSIYASDLIEKAQWFDSTPAAAGIGSQNSAYVSAATNPNFFSPAFFMCFGSPSLDQAHEVGTVHFSVSVTYYVAYRNPKFGGSSSSKDLPVKSVQFIDDDDDDPDDVNGDMEDDASIVVDENARIASPSASSSKPFPPPSVLDTSQTEDVAKTARRKRPLKHTVVISPPKNQ